MHWSHPPKVELRRSVIGNVVPKDAFRLNCDGPVMESRPALPHWPAGGGVYAAGFKNKPAGAEYSGAPVYSGRMGRSRLCPDGHQIDGVSGRPLPAVIWLGTVHSLNSAPFQPFTSVPPRSPMPVVY